MYRSTYRESMSREEADQFWIWMRIIIKKVFLSYLQLICTDCVDVEQAQYQSLLICLPHLLPATLFLHSTWFLMVTTRIHFEWRLNRTERFEKLHCIFTIASCRDVAGAINGSDGCLSSPHSSSMFCFFDSHHSILLFFYWCLASCEYSSFSWSQFV